jgi:PST family polysaccharide transporter
MIAPAASASSELRRSFALHVVTTLSASGGVLLAVAVANVLIGRTLGVNGQGQIAAATLIPMMVGYAGELGLPVATGYMVNVDASHRGTIIATSRALALLFSGILTVVSVALELVLPLESDVRLLGLIFSAFVGTSLMYRVHLALLQADFRLRAFNRVRVAGGVAYLLILSVLTVTRTMTVLTVILALLASNLLWLTLSATLAFSRPWLALDRSSARALLGYGARAHIGNVSSIDTLQLDQLVLALFLAVNPLGLYVAAMTIITGNRVIGTSIGALCFPIASRADRGRTPESRHQFLMLCAGALALSCLVATAEVVLGSRLVAGLFGPSFRPAGRILQVLAVGSVFMNLRQVTADWLRGCGRPGVVTVSELFGVAALGILSYIFWDGTVLPVAWAISVASVVALACLGLGVLVTARKQDTNDGAAIDSRLASIAPAMTLSARSAHDPSSD